MSATGNPTNLDSDGNLTFFSSPPGPKVVTISGLSPFPVLCVAPNVAMELGHATSTVNTSLTSTLTGITGLSCPVVVPASGLIFVEAELPQVICNSGPSNGFGTGLAGTTVTLFMYEDGVAFIDSSISLPINGFGVGRISAPRVATPGAHTYTLSGVCIASSTATVLTAATTVPYLRVVAN
jgi:hypothetical protein